MRTKAQIHVLSGHNHTVCTVQAQGSDPQVITGSYDSQVKLWDLVAAKAQTTLTHHKKGVRAIALHPRVSKPASRNPLATIPPPLPHSLPPCLVLRSQMAAN